MHAQKTGAHSVLGRVKVSYPRIHHLLVPLDFSGKSRQALRYAVPLAQKFAAQVHLVHVLAPGSKTERAKLAAREEAARQRLDQMSEQLLPARLLAENHVLVGDPAKQILTLSKRLSIDLIVLTTKGEGGLRRLLLGSTAELIMRHAPCPVMSVRRQ